MSDSTEIVFPNPTLLNQGLRKNINFTGCHHDWKKVSAIIEQEELVSVKSLGSFASGITTAKNQITATMDSGGVSSFKVKAYVLGLNTPASMIGNNALLENLVYLTSVCAKLITQKHLLKNNVHVDIVKHISIKDASFDSVTMTYLFEFSNNQEAIGALDGLTSHARMLFCHGQGIPLQLTGTKVPKGKKNNVKQFGEAPEFTTYINVDPDFHVTAYVKPGKRGASYAVFESEKDADAIYAISETCVRLEVKLSRKWLERHRLLQPESWKGSLGVSAYKQVLDEFRHRLRVTEQLRRNVPQQRHQNNLSTMAAKVLNVHLSGGQAWQHPHMIPNRGPNAVAVYREILSKLHIDLQFSWADQHGKANPKLGDWLHWDNQYKVPANVAHSCMVRSTLKAKIALLKANVSELMATVSKGQAVSRNAKNKSSKPVTKKLLPIVRRQWMDQSSDETSDISDLMY